MPENEQNGDRVEEEVVEDEPETAEQKDAEEIIEEGDDNESLAGSEDSLDEHIKKLKSRLTDRESTVAKLKRTVKNKDPDERTVYVGQVDLSTLPEELYFDVFRDCGEISKVIIHTDPVTSLPRGFAYIEFEDLEGAEKAVKMRNKINWRGLKLQVCMKLAPVTPAISRLDYGIGGMGLMFRQPPPGLAAAGRPFGGGGKGGFAGAGIIQGGKGGAPIMSGKGFGGPLPPSAGMPIIAGDTYSRGRSGMPPIAGAPVYSPY